MFKIKNPQIGTYEVELSSPAGYIAPKNLTIEYKGDKNIIAINYTNIDIIPEGPISLNINFLNLKTLNNPDQQDTVDLEKQFIITGFDFVKTEDELKDILNKQNITLKSCQFTLETFKNSFSNISSGYYYIFQILNINGYTLEKTPDNRHNNLFYFKKEETTKNLIFTSIEKENIYFGIPVGDIEDEIEPFTLNIATGYSKESVQKASTFPYEIDFSGEIIDGYILSNLYNTIDLFGDTFIGWIKIQEQSISNDYIITINESYQNIILNMKLYNYTTILIDNIGTYSNN
jgi:hypothetical protein